MSLAVSQSRFREGLARWASGVAIVTSPGEEGPAGMTASAFTSVSLEPPLVLVCAARTAQTHEAIGRSRVFAVNILAAGQEALSRRFATAGNEAVRFEGLDCMRAPSGSPWITGAVAHLDCRVQSVHPSGDHSIIVGEVVAVEEGEGEPLVYFRGRYRRLEAP